MNYRIGTNLDLSKVESNYDLNKNQYDNCEVDMFYRLRMEVWIFIILLILGIIVLKKLISWKV
ncbi:hypothetical protein BKN14_04870 [Candidatus Gracilibacteria bacterium HOT-871]|nr:hypothetical protein BKN14_04870 [Candidatus Gracilibacteria bacterium HOT-871]RKW20474.1 MAG: hypothetical protein D8B46_09675 [Candidatus Gracilibacteria bacterium]